jgi:hypothetical protein
VFRWLHSTVQISKFFFLWKLPKSRKIIIGAFPKLLVSLVSTIPGRIQMVIKVAHLDLKLLVPILLIARKVPHRLAELFGGLLQVEENNVSIHDFMEYWVEYDSALATRSRSAIGCEVATHRSHFSTLNSPTPEF